MGADAMLIEASRRGDRDAFAAIIVRYQRAVHAVAFAGVRDRALADDVAQETFVTAWRRLGELRDATRLPAWLCGIARNVARDARKRLRTRAAHETATALPGEDAAMRDPTTPFDELSEAETERLLAAALERVPDLYREPLVLYYYEERTVDDVARSLGISTATTNKRLSRGRQYLAESVAIVERGMPRLGPSPTLVASVLAAIGVLAAPTHVEAATVKGTSNMHKLALAAVITASIGGAGLLLVDTQRGDARPRSAPAGESRPGGASPSATTTGAAPHAPPPSASPHTAAAPTAPAALGLFAMMHAAPPALPPTAPAAGGAAAAATANDCATVGRHLADLDNDTTHGATNRPDPASCEQCAARYASHCESEKWSVERRTCTPAAADLINAHLCAGGVTARDTKPAAIPAELTCAALAPKLAAVAQGAGLHPDVTDLDDQIAAACEDGNWSLELRTCLKNGNTMDAFQTCIMPAH